MVTDKFTLSDCVVKAVQGFGFILRANGDIEEYNPNIQSGAKFVYNMDEVRKKCGFDYFELARMDKIMMICDEEGLLVNKPINHNATMIWQLATHCNNPIVGDVVLCNTKAVR
jgi:hypothetical protein